MTGEDQHQGTHQEPAQADPAFTPALERLDLQNRCLALELALARAEHQRDAARRDAADARLKALSVATPPGTSSAAWRLQFADSPTWAAYPAAPPPPP